jgi:hypothetical protein
MVVSEACDTCGASEVPLESVGRFSQCARCKVRSQSYVRGQKDDGATREALVKSAEAMFRAMCRRGVRAVEMLEAAMAVGERPVADFLDLVERGDRRRKSAQAPEEAREDGEPSEDGQLARRIAAERYAAMHNGTSPDSAEG